MKKDDVVAIMISPPKFQVVKFKLEGISPYVQGPMSERALSQMRATQLAGSTAGSRSKKSRPGRDFDADYEGAKHVSTEGWLGIPAMAFRNACIDVCRVAGYQMTKARMSLFVVADGYNQRGQPLVKIKGDPEKLEAAVPNANGAIDIRVRPMWREWSASIKVKFDSDQFTLQDVTNLLSRAGEQVGIGAGRPFSKESGGCGWGQFQIKND